MPAITNPRATPLRRQRHRDRVEPAPHRSALDDADQVVGRGRRQLGDAADHDHAAHAVEVQRRADAGRDHVEGRAHPVRDLVFGRLHHVGEGQRLRRRLPLRLAQALDHSALRRERLEAAAPAATAQPVVAGDRRVADLAAHRQSALVDAPAQHQRAADAVGDVDDDEVVTVGPRAELAERERPHLLHQADRGRPDLAQDPGQIGVLGPVQVGRQQHAAGPLVDDARGADHAPPTGGGPESSPRSAPSSPARRRRSVGVLNWISQRSCSGGAAGRPETRVISTPRSTTTKRDRLVARRSCLPGRPTLGRPPSISLISSTTPACIRSSMILPVVGLLMPVAFASSARLAALRPSS